MEIITIIQENIKKAKTFGLAEFSLFTPKNTVICVRLNFYYSIQSWYIADGLDWQPISGEALYEILSIR